jgi:hypothetical protein
MQLRTARLCLDCEEVHQEQECPICLSEASVYLTRWIPVEERRRTERRLPSAVKVTPERTGVARWVQRGMVGLALIAASRWLLHANDRTGSRNPSGKRQGSEKAERPLG